jgi:hypothetical protein
MPTPGNRTYNLLCDILDKELAVPITRHGILTHFNGIDVKQTRTHITISVEKYLDNIFATHGWQNLIPFSLPMQPDNDFVKSLDNAVPLEPEVCAATDKNRFRYRGAIGELIWPMVTCRPELLFPVAKLSQFSVAPAMIHYDAVLAIFRYLSATKHEGITYTRIIIVESLPRDLPPARSAHPSDAANDHLLQNLYALLFGYADSDWAMDIVRHH